MSAKRFTRFGFSLILALMLVLSVFCLGCGSTSDEGGGDSQKDVVPAVVTHESWNILTGKPTETTVHKFVTDKEGPKLVLVGGIHGDEVAGWTAALDLVESIPTMNGVCGEILLIPQANILADNAQVRYAVPGTNIYSDLNRSFEVGRLSSAKNATIEISDALVSVITEFIGQDVKIENDYDVCIIDFHESLSSYVDGGLGDEILGSNNPFFMEDVLDRFNDYYLGKGETRFSIEPSCKAGSFSLNFTNLYPKATVFTIETNRGNVGGINTIALNKRVTNQLNLINAVLDYAWQRI